MSSTNDASSPKLVRRLSEAEIAETKSEENAAPPRRASWLTAGFLVIADVVGVGVMSLPGAYGQLGWFLGIISTFAWGCAVMWIGLLVIEARDAWPTSLSFGDLAFHAFDGSARAKRVVAFIVYLNLFLCLGDYILVTALTLNAIFYDAPTQFCHVVWVAFAGLTVLPAMQYRLLAVEKSLVALNFLLIWLSVLIALGTLSSSSFLGGGGAPASLLLHNSSTSFVESDMTVFDFFGSQSLFAFSFAGVSVYLEIMSEMTNPAEFRRSLTHFAVPAVTLTYFVTATWGYAYLGKTTTGLLIENLAKGPSYRAAAVCLFVHMNVCFMVSGTILARAIHRYAFPATLNDWTAHGRTVYFAITFLLVVAVGVMAVLIPKFDDFTGLIGSLTVPYLNYVFPIIFAYRARMMTTIKGGRVSTREWIAGFLVAGFAVLLFFVGTYSNVNNIVDHWSDPTKGGGRVPFQC